MRGKERREREIRKIPLIQVTSESDVTNTLLQGKEKFGSINTAVNCAGIYRVTTVINNNNK